MSPRPCCFFFQQLDAALLLHVLGYVCGQEALEHWRGETADCLLCPMAEGEAIPMITAGQAAMRGRCRLVCRDWCCMLGGPYIRHCGFRSEELPPLAVVAPCRSSTAAPAAVAATASAAAAACARQHHALEPAAKLAGAPRAFGPWNGAKLFGGVRSVTMAVSLRMLALDAWHDELERLAPLALMEKASAATVALRLHVERTGRESHGEWEAVLRRMLGNICGGRRNGARRLLHGGVGVGAAAAAADAATTTDEDDTDGMEEMEDSDEEARAVFGPPPPLPGGMLGGVPGPPLPIGHGEHGGLLPPPPPLLPAAAAAAPHPFVTHSHHQHLDAVAAAINQNMQQDGGIMGGLGGAVFGAGHVGDAQLAAEENAIDAITSHLVGLRRPPLLALPRPPPPRPGFVLREVSLAHLSSRDGAGASHGHRRAAHHFLLKDEMVHALLRHLPPTLERLTLARNPHLYTPLAPLITEPILPALREVYLDGAWRVCTWSLRMLEAARPPPRLFIDLLHEDFGNGRGLATGGRPCGMKEVVILNGRHRGSWVKCFIIHKAGPLRYHIKVLPTTDYDCAVGFSGRPALDVSRRHLRHHCSRKEE